MVSSQNGFGQWRTRWPRAVLLVGLLLLLGGELLAERCRTDDLMPSISLRVAALSYMPKMIF